MKGTSKPEWRVVRSAIREDVSEDEVFDDEAYEDELFLDESYEDELEALP